MRALSIVALICCVAVPPSSAAGQRTSGQGRGSQGSATSGTVAQEATPRAEGGRASAGEAGAAQPARRQQGPYTSKLETAPARPSNGGKHGGRGWVGGWGPGLAVPFDPFWWSAPPPEADAAAAAGDLPRPPNPDFVRPPAGPSLIQPAPFRPPALAIMSASGILRVNVQPSFAQLYVDGFFIGAASDFGTTTPGLALPPGWHRLEFRAPGHFTPAVNVTIDADRVTTYEGVLQPTPR